MGAGLVNVDVGGIFKGITSIASEFIEDKDKLNEFNARINEGQQAITLELIKSKTHPTVDAIVKLMYAFIPFFRPIGSAAMTVFAIYAKMKGIELDPTSNVALIGAFPMWMASRHYGKGKK